MIWVIGMISVLGIVTGIYSLAKIGKVKAIVELLLAILCPTIAIMFGSFQSGRAFGGTKLEFFIYSATVDGDIFDIVPVCLFKFKYNIQCQCRRKKLRDKHGKRNYI